MNWRPHTQLPPPDSPITTVLIARQLDGELGFYLLEYLYYWDGAQFVSEVDDEAVTATTHPFWWIPESEVLQNLKRGIRCDGKRF